MKTTSKKSASTQLLSGGNPQIEKGDGVASVGRYIEAMPGWKREVGRRLDALIESSVPDVQKAVRWNSPFYGLIGQGWFVSFHCFSKYIKVAFLNGASLRPLPPIESKHATTRYVHVHEGAAFDETQFISWIRQGAAEPGQPLF